MLLKKLSSLGLRWFTRLYKDELMDAAYQGILGRPPVAEEKSFHAEALARTADLAQPLRALSRSDELAFQLPYTKILEHRKSAHRAYLKSLPHTSTSNKNILLLGNCQARALGRLMQAMLGAADTTAIELLPDVLTRLAARDSVLSQQIAGSDLIYVHPHAEALRILEQNYPQDYRKVRLVPRITFSAFHPDIDYVEDAAHNQVHGPIGAYQSSLVFLAGKMACPRQKRWRFFALKYLSHWAILLTAPHPENCWSRRGNWRACRWMA